MSDLTVRVASATLIPKERRIGRVTTRPAFRVIHRYDRDDAGNIQFDANGDAVIIAHKEFIPGLRAYIQWYSDGTYTGIGALFDELQPFGST